MYNSGGAMILIQRGQEFFIFYFFKKITSKKTKVEKKLIKNNK